MISFSKSERFSVNGLGEIGKLTIPILTKHLLRRLGEMLDALKKGSTAVSVNGCWSTAMTESKDPN